jgi:hypothetical protein
VPDRLTRSQRTLRARLAAHESWAATPDRAARTAAGHRSSPASIDYWEPKVDPERTMTPEARRAAARSKRDAYMVRLAYNAAKARRARQAGSAA